VTNIYWEVRLVVQKIKREKFEHVFSFEGFVEENTAEASDTGIDQCIKNHLVNLQSRFSKYFPEVVSDKYKWITGDRKSVV
jgi:hypothetical protein